MLKLAGKYIQKAVVQNLAEKRNILFGVSEDRISWSSSNPLSGKLSVLFKNLSINSLLFAIPKEPGQSIIRFLAASGKNPLEPQDTETRTFLHDLPVAFSLDEDEILPLLQKRKGIIVAGPECAIITTGTVTPEQAFVSFSSMLFACFVKYHHDYLMRSRRGLCSDREKNIFQKIRSHIRPVTDPFPGQNAGALQSTDDILSAMETAGARTVRAGLVDSYFGNISFLKNETVFISQTGSSLEELAGLIDQCPMDNSSCAGLTASSELSAHKAIYRMSDFRTVLHGHPKFSVIMSLDCPLRQGCPNNRRCHTHCTEKRFAGNTPIVCGEVGTGPFGLHKTVPPAIAEHGSVIVYGHGVFTAGKKDFNQAFAKLMAVEENCRIEYYRQLNS